MLIAVDSAPFALTPLLDAFAAMARESSEWQGDGWGCAWRAGGRWRVYHGACPVWDDDRSGFGFADVFLVHARSAFRDEGTVLAHNMPFLHNNSIFIFNGELRGVRLAAPGRIGAEKLFHVIEAGTGTAGERIARGLRLVRSRARHIRALNFALFAEDAVHVHAEFAGEAEYFTLWQSRRGHRIRVCSMPLADGESWEPLPNPHDEVLSCSF